jgi:hypothetical protein
MSSGIGGAISAKAIRYIEVIGAAVNRIQSSVSHSRTVFALKNRVVSFSPR